MIAEKTLACCRSMRDHALFYFERYHWAIVPCHPHEKRPSIDDWNRHPLVSFEDVDVHYQSREDDGIGIHPMRSGLACFDIDNKRDETIRQGPFKGCKRDGIASFKSLLKEGIFLPNTTTLLSPAGGYKQLYRCSSGMMLQDCKDVIAPGVELLFATHQAIIPPSYHPAGGRYEWVWSPEQVPNGAMDMPPALLDFLYKRNLG